LILGWLVRAWLWLVRVRVVLHPSLESHEGPLVWAFWHGSQMALLSQKRRRPTAVLVSLSKDGELQSKVMANHGMLVVRGSSSRRGASGLRGLLRHLARGHDVAFAVDGPRGPLHRVKPGVLACGYPIVPVGVIYERAITLGSWDRFQIPLPFSRVTIVAGAPLESPDAETLASQICSQGVRRGEQSFVVASSLHGPLFHSTLALSACADRHHVARPRGASAEREVAASAMDANPKNLLPTPPL
jgi:lysophospholipid acyltransferase (LPLAT)-like uncharacterized protein